MKEFVVLVDAEDQERGVEEKLSAHKRGQLHRALSVFVFNSKGEWLLQRRALSKYHSAGLWTNTCCSHPRPEEGVETAACRRLREEMGFVCFLNKIFTFTYRAELEGGLVEHEFDHVFIGVYDGKIQANAEEVCEWKWVNYEELKKDLSLSPESYTAWFKQIFERVYRSLPDQLSLVRNVAK